MNVKGSALRSTLNYLRERYTPEQTNMVMSVLYDDQRKTLESPILVSSWYEADLLYALLRSMAAQLGEQPQALYEKVGRQSCDDGLNTVVERALELAGAKKIRFSHTECCHRGGANCEWKAEWE